MRQFNKQIFFGNEKYIENVEQLKRLLDKACEYLGGMQQPADPTIEDDYKAKISEDARAQQIIEDAICDIAVALLGEDIIFAKEESIKAHILRNWPRDRVIRFSKHLLGDECQNKIYCPKL